MSKTKKSTIEHYEILFIMPNKFTEDEAKTIIGNVEKVIADNGGQISFREYWGKKKLAYGYYSLCEFDLEKSALAAIDQNLRLSTDVLRYQIVIRKAKSEAELAKDKKINAKIEAKKAIKEKEAQDKSKKQSEAAEAPAKSAVKKERPTDMKDLDEKLEGILSAKDLI